MKQHWEHYDEGGSGIGVRGFGETEAHAFEQAALALTAAMADPSTIAPVEKIVLHCEAGSEDALLAAWLDAVARRMLSSRMLFSRFEVWLDGTRLTAHAWGEAANAQRHNARLRLRRARPNSQRVARHGDGWMAQAIMDV